MTRPVSRDYPRAKRPSEKAVERFCDDLYLTAGCEVVEVAIERLQSLLSEAPPAKWQRVNLNQKVRVTLKPEGVRILERVYGRPVPGLVGNVWVTHVWVFVREFGEHTRFGFDSPYQATVEIQTE